MVCRPCAAAYQRENYAKNAERIRKRKAADMAAARKDPVMRERIRASQRKSWKNGGSEKRRAYMERIRIENPWLWKTITIHGAYRGQNGADVLKAIWDRQGGLCGLTGQPLDFETAQLDHILPRSRGGSYDESNLRWTTKHANEAKGGMTDDEFLVLCNQVAEFIGRRLIEFHQANS